MRDVGSGIVIVLLVSGALGCGATKQPTELAPLGREVVGAGFLGDLYPQMVAGEGDQPLRVYRSPTFTDPAAFSRYTRLSIERVVLYGGSDSKLAELPDEARADILAALDTQLRDKLAPDYELVAAPAENTLRLEAAVVDVEESWAKTEAISELPIPMGVPGAKAGLVLLASTLTGKPPFTGEITVEAKLSDAATGEVVAAMLDRRVGVRKPFIGFFQPETYDSWADVDEAIRYFAERVRHTLCIRRGGTDCIAPEA